jgi:hypothetical protein
MEGLDDATRALRSTLESSAVSSRLSGGSSAVELEAPLVRGFTTTQQVGAARCACAAGHGDAAGGAQCARLTMRRTSLQMAMRLAEAATEAAVARAAGSLGSSGSRSSSSGSGGGSGIFRVGAAASTAYEQHQEVGAQPSFTSLEQLPSDLDAYDLGSSAALAGDEVVDAHGGTGEASDGSVF